MIRIILILTFIGLGIEKPNEEEVSKYFYDGTFSKSYLELNYNQKKFTYNSYSCLNDWAEGDFKIKGNRLVLKTTSERKILDRSKFYFIDNGKKLVCKYRFRLKKYKHIYELKEEE